MKNIPAIIICISAALLHSCEKKAEPTTIPDEKLSRIMADIYTAEAATNGLSGYTKDSLMQVYFKQVMDMHGVTKEEYEKNLRLIVHDIPRIEAIVNQAEEYLDIGKKSGDKKGDQ